MIFLDVLYIFILMIYIPLNPRFLFKKEYREIIKGRFSPGVDLNKRKSIWIHAVSVGEVKSLESFISLLQAKTDKRIILSVTTPSGFRIAGEIFKDIEVINGPFDLSFVVKRFIKKINPSIIILNELEIWPNWISIADRMDIPMAVINGRISAQAFKRYKRFSFLIGRFFRKIDLFLLQEENYIDKFIALGVNRNSIRVSGNIKADEAVTASGKAGNSEKIFELLGINKPEKRVLLFASTHSSDESIFIPSLQELTKKYFVIIAPRHMNRITEIAGEIEKNGIEFRIWSSDQPSDKEILIFDKMGYLTELIKISNVVFMGGSFDPDIGGHNLYEPAVFGKKIVGGPYYNNFPSIGNELVQNGVYTITENTNSLTDFLMNINKKDIEGSVGKAEETVVRRSGAIEFSIREVLKFLN
ncbi:MAG: glycosyltransferase N-terminal domain-containing protein [Acidobacteriota bacterium]